MIILDIAHLAKSFGTDEVLKDVTLRVQTGDRLGLVGVNGSGKSTLLRILMGELQADEGTVSILKGTRIGYMTQIFHPEAGSTVLSEAQAAVSGLQEMEEKLRVLERKMGEEQEQTRLTAIMEDYGRLTEAFERGGGYEVNSKVQGVLLGLGFSQGQFSQMAHTLSGGELTRLGLAKLLLQSPDLLLLDEPTNHLDMQTLTWLETYLKDYRGAVMMVSHDRYFLDAVCTDIAELLFGTVENYSGNYTAYLAQRDERFAARNKAYALQQKEILRQQAIIARFRSFNREKSIRAAESREKALARMELLDRPEEEKQVVFRFETRRLLGDIALEAQGLSKSFDGKPLFQDLSFQIRGGDRVALIGPNGIGKTTLLRCLMGSLEPDGGEYRFGPKAQVGYFDQRQQNLNLDNDPLNEIWDAFPQLNQSQVRGALGLFLFRGDDVFTPISLLSGGERARVSLTKLMLRKDNFLLLDEPTNHLDADSREALEKALEGYEGTILAVSHDRYFINRFANRVFSLGPEGLTAFEGNYDDYLDELERLNNPDGPDSAEKTKTELARERKAEREKERLIDALRLAQSQAEETVHHLEGQYQKALNEQALPEIYANPAKASAQAAICKALKEKLDLAYGVWETAALDLEAALENSAD